MSVQQRFNACLVLHCLAALIFCPDFLKVSMKNLQSICLVFHLCDIALSFQSMWYLANAPYLIVSLNFSTILWQYFLKVWLAYVMGSMLTSFQASHKTSSSTVLNIGPLVYFLPHLDGLSGLKLYDDLFLRTPLPPLRPPLPWWYPWCHRSGHHHVSFRPKWPKLWAIETHKQK